MATSDLRWRKSRRSQDQGACVELAGLSPAWRKSSYTNANNNDCVELADLTGTVAFRDSKNPDGDVVLVGRAGFGALLAQLKA